MASVSHFLLLLLISVFHQTTCVVLRLPSNEETELLYCNSWRLSVETHNAGDWFLEPESRCDDYIIEYIFGEQYQSDLEVVASRSLSYAKTVNITGDGMDAWVFDVYDTLLSIFQLFNGTLSSKHPTLYSQSKHFQESWKDEGADIPYSPALNASLKLYNKLKNMGFTIFLLTTQSEISRENIVRNLKFVGYNGWERLIMRGPTDSRHSTTRYKSQRRSELIYEGYRIHGNSGDQWSDLQGFATAERSFKLPNPVYYVP